MKLIHQECITSFVSLVLDALGNEIVGEESKRAIARSTLTRKPASESASRLLPNFSLLRESPSL